MEDSGVQATVDPASARKDLKRKGGASPEQPPPTRARMEQDDTVPIDFLYFGKGHHVLPLPLKLLFEVVTHLRAHRNVFRGGNSLARALGKSTSASAHFQGSLRSFIGAPRACGNNDANSVTWPAVIEFAGRDPEAFACHPSLDGFRSFNMNGVTIKIHEEDYLAIRSGRLQPCPYMYVTEDLEKELGDTKAENELIRCMISELERGEIEATVE